MLKENLAMQLSRQFNAEYYSAYLYLVMAASADRMGFKGFSNWLFVQAQEEMAHGTHMYQHILERSASPLFFEVEKPRTEYKNLTEIFEKVLSHEQHVTELINAIATSAVEEKDHATYNFLQWYINEQVEEESTADEILTKLKLIGDNTGMLYNMDAEMAARIFVDPFAAAVQ